MPGIELEKCRSFRREKRKLVETEITIPKEALEKVDEGVIGEITTDEVIKPIGPGQDVVERHKIVLQETTYKIKPKRKQINPPKE